MVTLAASTSMTYLFITPNVSDNVHLNFTCRSSLNGLLELYEGPDATATTALNIYNMNRGSANVSGVTLFSSATVSTTGSDRLVVNVVGTDGTNPLGDSGGITQREDEIMLKTNTKYLIKYTSLSANNRVSTCFEFAIKP